MKLIINDIYTSSNPVNVKYTPFNYRCRPLQPWPSEADWPAIRLQFASSSTISSGPGTDTHHNPASASDSAQLLLPDDEGSGSSSGGGGRAEGSSSSRIAFTPTGAGALIIPSSPTTTTGNGNGSTILTSNGSSSKLLSGSLSFRSSGLMRSSAGKAPPTPQGGK